MLTPGDVLQTRYRIVSLLGQGGMGAVYRAWDMRLSVPVALKEMIPQPGLSPQMLDQLRQQFRQEATVLARLIHPHLVRVTDFFEEGGNAYLVMDFVEGKSLSDIIKQRGALPEENALDWARQLLDALGYCHRQGIIHRDVKPQNVVIRPDGRAVLVDFGLVKLWDPNDPRTRTAMRGMGTPEYAPPEQYEADVGHTDPCSDVYSLGATIYHALVGQAPPTATLRMASPERFVPVRHLNPRVSSNTEQVILKALKLPRSERWQSAAEMASALGGEKRVSRPARVAPQTPPSSTHGQARSYGRARSYERALPDARPAPAAETGRRRPVWPWLLGGAALFFIFVCVGLIWGVGQLAQHGESIQTATAQAQATGAAQATAIAQANAAATAESIQATKTAQAQATSTPRLEPAQATATAQAEATISALGACLHRSLLAPLDWDVIECDAFDDDANDWSLGEYDGSRAVGNRQLVDGKLVWDAEALSDVIWWTIPDLIEVDDFYMTTEARQVNGVETAQYGVIFRRVDSDNYGLFKIEDSQYFKFSIRHEGEWYTIIDWTKTSAIRPGEWNRLTVLGEGDHFTFYINDQYVDETDESRLSRGQVGIALELLDEGDTALFEFDNFELRAP